MIGVFDSGRGGLAAASAIRKALPHADIAYLADRKNAPYGTKKKAELVRLVSEDIRRLVDIGCDRILIACCTASTVHSELSECYQRISLPIIAPTARLAAWGATAGVTVFATEATVRSGEFGRKISECDPTLSVSEVAAQNLVRLIEEGATRDRLYREVAMLARAVSGDTDTVVLGCTHFSFAKEIFGELLPSVRIIDSATVGAQCIISAATDSGRGRCIFT
jgi:glutamate racemase